METQKSRVSLPARPGYLFFKKSLLLRVSPLSSTFEDLPLQNGRKETASASEKSIFQCPRIFIGSEISLQIPASASASASASESALASSFVSALPLSISGQLCRVRTRGPWSKPDPWEWTLIPCENYDFFPWDGILSLKLSSFAVYLSLKAKVELTSDPLDQGLVEYSSEINRMDSWGYGSQFIGYYKQR